MSPTNDPRQHNRQPHARRYPPHPRILSQTTPMLPVPFMRIMRMLIRVRGRDRLEDRGDVQK